VHTILWQLKEKWVSGEVWKLKKGQSTDETDASLTWSTLSLVGSRSLSLSVTSIAVLGQGATQHSLLLHHSWESTQFQEQEEQDLASIDLLEVPSIVDDGVSLLDKSQPVWALFPDPEPVDETQRELAAQEARPPPTPPPPTPVPQPVVQWQVPADEAEEDSDESVDDDSDIKPTVTTDNINWYTDLEYFKCDINGSVETISWQFKTGMGKEMTEKMMWGWNNCCLSTLWPACLHKQ
jgi:hypothetical protein